MENSIVQSFGWFFAGRFWWLRHLAFWVFRYSDWVLAKMGIIDDFEAGLSKFLTLHLLPDLALVYFTLLVLIPKLLFRKKITWFVLAGFATVLAYALCTHFQDPNPDPEETTSTFTRFFTWDFVDGATLFLMATGLRVMLEFLYASVRMQELKTENLQTELAFLKGQINPHFLFNTLNNIATLSEISPDKVSPTIVQLSKVLRYQLYESEKTRVPLRTEIENLKNYLKLEAMRQDQIRYDLTTDGDLAGVEVAPLLFLPFLENAVKHSADPNGDTYINMAFKKEGDRLYFACENSKPAVAPKVVKGGIGLKNVRRRLELLYPKKHELQIEDLPGKFLVRMTIFEL